MNLMPLEELIKESEKAPEYKETAYWARYRTELLNEVRKMDVNDLRSGKHPRFASFGFNEFFPKRSFYNKSKDIVKLIFRYLFSGKSYNLAPLSPYSLTPDNVRKMAYHHCELKAQLTHSKDISTIEASAFGRPEDLFTINGRKYTMAFLSYYIRYCFANGVMSFKGDEVIVELGSGSGHQIEILKKLYPGMTILCFDLPVPLFLCEQYLTEVLGADQIVSSQVATKWTDLSKIERGKVHFFGNWMFPLLRDLKFDLFWNAASFGEMEPEVVNGYLNTILGNCEWIYLLQVREGKLYVNKKSTFEDYNSWLKGYSLIKDEDVFRAHKKLTEESDYFQGVWKRK